MTPHLFLRPRTLLPSITTVRSEPTTAKGIIACNHSISHVPSTQDSQRPAYPDLGVDLNFLIVRLLSVEGIQTDVMVNEFGADLHDNSRLIRAPHLGSHNPSTSGMTGTSPFA